jgi:hypothetical protein
MAKIDVVGTEQPLSHSPVSSPSTPPHSGAFQLVGEEVPLNRTPIPSPSTPPHKGEMQIVGETLKLDHTPSKGWGDAANLPMSERSHAASAVGGGRKKR